MVLQHRLTEIKGFKSRIISMNWINQNCRIPTWLKRKTMKHFVMKSSLLIVFGTLLTFLSCRKEDVKPLPPDNQLKMEYFDLGNRDIKAFTPGFSVDVNHDGRKDLKFGALLVGDPIEQVDKVQFFISTAIGIYLPVNSNESIPIMNNGDSILLDDFNGYQWFELSSIVLVQKVISDNKPDSWEGAWKDASHKFIPFQVKNADKKYNGWVEISVDISNEKLILHKAAISSVADQIVCAGK